MYFIRGSVFTKQDLYSTSPDALIRFAKYLDLHTDGYSHRQRARIIYWLLTRRYANPHAGSYDEQ